jgi:L-cysteate sulfo-lyase
LPAGATRPASSNILLGDALANDADTLITQGAVQSNHVRQTAAVAAKFGLACEVILEAPHRQTNATGLQRAPATSMLDELLGAKAAHACRPGPT